MNGHNTYKFGKLLFAVVILIPLAVTFAAERGGHLPQTKPKVVYEPCEPEMREMRENVDTGQLGWVLHNGRWVEAWVRIPAALSEAYKPYMLPGATAQTPPSITRQEKPEETVTRWHEPIEIAFGASILVFGAVIIAMEIWFLRSRPSWDASWYLKTVGLTLVLTGGLFLIVAGFTQQQMAPMMGLLGTVAGYLLGKEAKAPAPIGAATTDKPTQL